MKWWKQSKSEYAENPISVLDDRLFSIKNTKYNFKELLHYIQSNNLGEQNSDDHKLVDLAIYWMDFLKDVKNTPESAHAELVSQFETNVIHQNNLLEAFDSTFQFTALYYTSNDYFELENFIIPIVLKIECDTVDKKMVGLIMRYFSKSAVQKTLKEIKSYNLKVDINELERALPEILVGNAKKFGHQYNIIANMHSMTTGGLGPINGFIRLYYDGEDASGSIMEECFLLLKRKFRQLSILKESNRVDLQLVKNKMISKVNAGYIKTMSGSNNGIINTIDWLSKVGGDVVGGDDDLKYNTIINCLDELHKNAKFSSRKPSKKLVKSINDFILLSSSYNNNSLYGVSDMGNSYDNFIFHPFITKVLQSDYVDEKLIKNIVSRGTNTGILMLSVLKCRTKNKHFKKLIKNNIYNLSVKKKLLAEKKLFGLSRKIHANLNWSGTNAEDFWEKQQHKNHIIKSKLKAVQLIEKTCDCVFNDIRKKNGNHDLIVFG